MGRQYIWRHRLVVGRQYIWRHRGWWGVNTYGVIGGGGASIHMASYGAVGRQYIWRHRG